MGRWLGSLDAHVHALAHGRRDRAAGPEREAKSTGSELTLDMDDGGDDVPRRVPEPIRRPAWRRRCTRRPRAHIEIASDDQ